MPRPLFLIALVSQLFLFSYKVNADCQSYGIDFLNGGSYFINTDSTVDFSFGTQFEGCNGTTDAQDGVITPIVVDPDENEYFCSDIAITPEGVTMNSICNVAGNELTKSSMYSGEWIIIIEGLTFAWMRTFTITAGPQATVTVTPTAVFSITTTPSATINSTSFIEYDTTLTPSTVTMPSITLSKPTTVTPKKVTSTSTISKTKTLTKYSFTAARVTSTRTASCTTKTTKKDPPCTIFPTKTNIASQVIAVQATAAAAARVKDRRFERGSLGLHPAKRSADLATTTVTETSVTVSVNTTITEPTSTEIDTVFATITSTITPTPVTILSGKTVNRVTVTAPTPTRTMYSITSTKTTTTSVVVATIMMTKTVTPTCY